MDDQDECTCGHIWDEHDPECQVDDCGCVHFELAS